MKKTTLFLSLMISVGAFAQTSSNGGVVLQKGQVITAQTSSDAEIDMSMGGMKNSTVLKMKMTVIDEKPNAYILTSATTAMKMDMDGMGQTMSFDSEKQEDKDSEMGKQLSGKLSKLDTIEIAKKDGKATLLSQPSEDAENPMMMGMGNQNNGYGAAFLVIPSSAIGTTWTDSVSVKNSKTKITYTVQSVEGGVATIKQVSIMDGTNELETQGMTINMTLNMKTDAIIKVNTKNGMVLSNNATTDMTGNMDAMGQQIPISSKITSSSTFQ